MLDRPPTVKRTRSAGPWPWLVFGATAIGLLLGAAVAVAAGLADDGETVLAWRSPLGDVTYAPGRGLRLGDTGLTLGGYGNVNLARDEGHATELSLDDLSFFVIWDPIPRFHLFSELELENVFQVDDEGHAGNPGFAFNAERLYGDVAVSDALSVRVGKFLTPVGRWNVIHAQPLVWTTSRPLVTDLTFDTHTTGVMAFGALFQALGTFSYELYGQATDQLDPSHTPFPDDRNGGGRVAWSAPGGWSVGASYLAAESQGAWRNLGGVDGVAARDRYEVMGEAVVEDGQRRRDGRWGLYLQGVYELLPRWYLVGRYEHYERLRGPRPSNLVVTGLAWKPWPSLVVKGEYLSADHPNEQSPPGFKASIAVLF